jgi:periplasmic divalent cation tolerance protein
MKSARSFALVLVTAPNVKAAREIARAALDQRLVACANLVPRLESHYWWEGKIHRSSEVLILFKTRRRLLASLEKLVIRVHPYDTPEFLVVGLSDGNARYLSWLTSSTGE